MPEYPILCLCAALGLCVIRIMEMEKYSTLAYMYLWSNLTDSHMGLHQYILTLNNSVKCHNIDMKLYTNMRPLSPMLNVQFTKTDELYS